MSLPVTSPGSSQFGANFAQTLQAKKGLPVRCLKFFFCDFSTEVQSSNNRMGGYDVEIFSEVILVLAKRVLQFFITKTTWLGWHWHLFGMVFCKLSNALHRFPWWHLGVDDFTNFPRWDMELVSWVGTLPKTNIAMENPPFWWYLPGNVGIFYGYVSLTEGSVYSQYLEALSTNKGLQWFKDIMEQSVVPLAHLDWIGAVVFFERTSSAPWKPCLPGSGPPTSRPCCVGSAVQSPTEGLGTWLPRSGPGSHTRCRWCRISVEPLQEFAASCYEHALTWMEYRSWHGCLHHWTLLNSPLFLVTPISSP